MNKMATDTFSTFLLYLVENFLGIVRVTEQGQSVFPWWQWWGVSLSCGSGGTLTNTNMFETHKKKSLYLCGGDQWASNDPRKYLNQLKICLIEENISVLHMNMNQTVSYTQQSNNRQIYERIHKILKQYNYTPSNTILSLLLTQCICFYLSRILEYWWFIKSSASRGAEGAMFSLITKIGDVWRGARPNKLIFYSREFKTRDLAADGCFSQLSVLRSLTQLARWLPTQTVKMCFWSLGTSRQIWLSRCISTQQNFS